MKFFVRKVLFPHNTLINISNEGISTYTRRKVDWIDPLQSTDYDSLG